MTFDDLGSGDEFGEGDRTTVEPVPLPLLDLEEEPPTNDLDDEDADEVEEDPDPTPSPAQAALINARLASLSSLSLDKVGGAPATPQFVERRTSSKLPWILLVLFMTGGSYYHFSIVGFPWAEKNATQLAAGKAELKTEVVQATTTQASSFLAAGYIAARVPIVVGVTTSGRVKEVMVGEGDQVKRGQLLATLEAGQIEAELSLARAKEKAAQRDLNRARTLLKAQAATATDLERAQSHLDIAAAERRVAASKLEQTRIRAPITGTVLQLHAHPGEVLTPAPDAIAGVVTVADLQDIVGEVDVNEGDIAKIRIGQRAEVASDAKPEPSYPGKVREIAQQADRARGTVLVRVELENVGDGALKPGMAVKVRFLADGDATPRILIPRAAVEAGQVSVVGADGSISKRSIQTEVAGPSLLEVRAGLTPGERIVVP